MTVVTEPNDALSNRKEFVFIVTKNYVLSRTIGCQTNVATMLGCNMYMLCVYHLITYIILESFYYSAAVTMICQVFEYVLPNEPQ